MSLPSTNYEEEVISDKSDAQSTEQYYNAWSGKKKVVFIEGEDSLANAAGPITDVNDTVTTCTYYGQWSNKYESDMVVSSYNGPKHVANAFVDLNLDKNTRILDLLAGSGLVAELIRPHGYTNIDAIDGSPDMLALAKKKGLYKHYHVSYLGGEHKAPIEDNTYDAIISCGSFAPGHLYSDVFGDLIRIVKPGGLIVWSMRNDYSTKSDKYARFEEDVEVLVTQNVWSHHRPRKDVDQYLLGSDGYVYTMQKL